MPTAPKTIRLTRQARRENRLNAYQRGYGREWARVAALWIDEQMGQGNTRCAACHTPLTGARDTMHVDHKIPHRGRNDPLFWMETNFQLLCRSCHSRKTVMQDGGFGRPKK